MVSDLDAERYLIRMKDLILMRLTIQYIPIPVCVHIDVLDSVHSLYMCMPDFYMIIPWGWHMSFTQKWQMKFFYGDQYSYSYHVRNISKYISTMYAFVQNTSLCICMTLPQFKKHLLFCHVTTFSLCSIHIQALAGSSPCIDLPRAPISSQCSKHNTTDSEPQMYTCNIPC